MASASSQEEKTMPSYGRIGTLSVLKNLFPTATHFLIFIGYMALFINQGMNDINLYQRNLTYFVFTSASIPKTLVSLVQYNTCSSSCQYWPHFFFRYPCNGHKGQRQSLLLQHHNGCAFIGICQTPRRGWTSA